MMKKYLILNLVLFGFLMSFPVSSGIANEDDQSVGTMAGETARDLTDQTRKAASAVSTETQQATKQFAQIADETFQKLSAQFQEAMKGLQQSGQELMKWFHQEQEKFKQAYNKPVNR